MSFGTCKGRREAIIANFAGNCLCYYFNMNKYLKNLLKGLGIVIILLAIAISYYVVTFEFDSTFCWETDKVYAFKNGYAEHEIGGLYSAMYTKVFDLNYYDVITYKLLTSTSTSADFTTSIIYLKTPEGIYYACGQGK